MDMNTLQLKLRSWADLFENSDFKEGSKSKRWWIGEFMEASKCKKVEILSKWADYMIYYKYDFDDSAYYVRDEIVGLLKKIRRLK